MSTIEISAGMLGARLRSDAIGAPKAVKLAIFSGAQRGRSWIVGKTPVDRGILRNAWRVLKMADGAELVNDQPYAGIMERGARPFKMSKAGRDALVGWVKRKILDNGMGFFSGSKSAQKQAISWAAKRQQAYNRMANKTLKRGMRGPKRNVNMASLRSKVVSQIALLDKEAERIAWAIAKNFEKVGIRGRRFVMMNLDILATLMEQEMDRFLSNFFNRQGV